MMELLHVLKIIRLWPLLSFTGRLVQFINRAGYNMYILCTAFGTGEHSG